MAFGISLESPCGIYTGSIMKMRYIPVRVDPPGTQKTRALSDR